MYITRINIPLLRAGDVVDTPRYALQPNGLTADGGANVIDIANGAQIQVTSSVDESALRLLILLLASRES